MASLAAAPTGDVTRSTESRPQADRVFSLILLLYLVGICAFNQDFAKLSLNVRGIPLYVGEAVIALLGVALVISAIRTRRLPVRVDAMAIMLLAYLGIGLLHAANGLRLGYGLASFRDFALVYYLVFFFFATAYLQKTGEAVTLLRAIAGGAALGAAVAVPGFVASPALKWEHGINPTLALQAWTCVMYLVLFRNEVRRREHRLLHVIVLVACGGAIFLSGYRTLAASLLASTAVIWLGSLWIGGNERQRLRTSAFMCLGFIALLVAWVLVVVSTVGPSTRQWDPNGALPLPDAVQAISARWVRGVVSVVSAVPLAPVAPDTAKGALATPGDALATPEGSMSFRLDAWRLALSRLAASPLLGIGYGPQAALHPDVHCENPSSATSNCGNAHNTFITLAMRMGIPAFLLFVAINVLVLYRLLRCLLRGAPEGSVARLAVLTMAVFASFALYGLMSLFFESPYLSSVYWVVLAVMHHLAVSHWSSSANTDLSAYRA